MRHALALSLLAALLGGCASHKPEDYNGVWINQTAIDAASKGTGLRYALERNGPNFEWKINIAASQASYSNGFELVEGRLKAVDEDHWQVELEGDQVENLELDGKELIQAKSDWAPEQRFQRSSTTIDPNIPPGAAFEQALYGAYLKGDWKVMEGPGQGGVVRFRDNGGLDGLPNLDRYALCLAGDCASMTGKWDSLWLERNQQGNPWIFKRDGKQLEIFQAINDSQPDEMPSLRPGERRWLLERK